MAGISHGGDDALDTFGEAAFLQEAAHVRHLRAPGVRRGDVVRPETVHGHHHEERRFPLPRRHAPEGERTRQGGERGEQHGRPGSADHRVFPTDRCRSPFIARTQRSR